MRYSSRALAYCDEKVGQVLRNMPYIQSANIATLDAANQMLPGGDVSAQR